MIASLFIGSSHRRVVVIPNHRNEQSTNLRCVQESTFPFCIFEEFFAWLRDIKEVNPEQHGQMELKKLFVDYREGCGPCTC